MDCVIILLEDMGLFLVTLTTFFFAVFIFKKYFQSEGIRFIGQKLVKKYKKPSTQLWLEFIRLYLSYISDNIGLLFVMLVTPNKVFFSLVQYLRRYDPQNIKLVQNHEDTFLLSKKIYIEAELSIISKKNITKNERNADNIMLTMFSNVKIQKIIRWCKNTDKSKIFHIINIYDLCSPTK